MTPALEKLQAKLFSRYTPAQLHIALSGMEVIPASDDNIGGLEFSLKTHRPTKVRIAHVKGPMFNIFIFWQKEDASNGMWITRNAVPTRFAQLHLALKELLDEVVAYDKGWHGEGRP